MDDKRDGMYDIEKLTIVPTAAFLLTLIYATLPSANTATIEKNGEIDTVKQNDDSITYTGNNDVSAIKNAIQMMNARTIFFKNRCIQY